MSLPEGKHPLKRCPETIAELVNIIRSKMVYHDIETYLYCIFGGTPPLWEGGGSSPDIFLDDSWEKYGCMSMSKLDKDGIRAIHCLTNCPSKIV